MFLLRNLLLAKKNHKLSIKMFQRRRPIFQRVSNILKVSILRRPIIPRLKLPIKQRRSAKRVKPLQQYNYKFLRESQFSPLRTSVISYNRKRNCISRLGLKRSHSLLSTKLAKRLCKCKRVFTNQRYININPSL